MLSQEIGPWLKNLAASVGIALLVGAVCYLIARATTSAYLLYQQQHAIQQTAALLREGEGIIALRDTNLRDIRRHMDMLHAHYQRLSLHIGLGAAALAALGSYLWLEHLTRKGREQSHLASSRKARE
jgi:H+/Cl- antiporter ClcA